MTLRGLLSLVLALALVVAGLEYGFGGWFEFSYAQLFVSLCVLIASYLLISRCGDGPKLALPHVARDAALLGALAGTIVFMVAAFMWGVFVSTYHNPFTIIDVSNTKMFHEYAAFIVHLNARLPGVFGYYIYGSLALASVCFLVYQLGQGVLTSLWRSITLFVAPALVFFETNMLLFASYWMPRHAVDFMAHTPFGYIVTNWFVLVVASSFFILGLGRYSGLSRIISKMLPESTSPASAANGTSLPSDSGTVASHNQGGEPMRLHRRLFLVTAVVGLSVFAFYTAMDVLDASMASLGHGCVSGFCASLGFVKGTGWLHAGVMGWVTANGGGAYYGVVSAVWFVVGLAFVLYYTGSFKKTILVGASMWLAFEAALAVLAPLTMPGHVANFATWKVAGYYVFSNLNVAVACLAVVGAVGGIGVVRGNLSLGLPPRKTVGAIIAVSLITFGTMALVVFSIPAPVNSKSLPPSFSGGHGENHDNPPVGNVTLWNGIINCTLPSGFSYSTNITLSQHDYLLYGANDTKMACLNGNATATWKEMTPP